MRWDVDVGVGAEGALAAAVMSVSEGEEAACGDS